jgi:hypothetical protein
MDWPRSRGFSETAIVNVEDVRGRKFADLVANNMKHDDLRCAKCANPMARGYTIDSGPGPAAFSADHASRWSAGPPIRRILKMRVPRGSLPIASYRCTKCGYLESYADAEFESKQQFSLRVLFIAVTIVAVVLGLIVSLIRLSN